MSRRIHPAWCSVGCALLGTGIGLFGNLAPRMSTARAAEASSKPSPIGGVFEVGIGTRDPEPLIRYWQQFGYRLGPSGELSAEQARVLYGVESHVRSIRLLHQDADHGLVRIFVWDRPTSEGLGLSSFKVLGSRWATSMTTDVLGVANHAEAAKEVGLPIRLTSPTWVVIYGDDVKKTPFIDPLPGVREMMMVQPLTRQILFERFNYTLPFYGKIDETSFFHASQITHVGLVIPADRADALSFYENVLGLLRVSDGGPTSYDKARASRAFFDLEPGESYFSTDFDDPRSSKADLRAVRSGRLKFFRFLGPKPIVDRFSDGRPGALGMSLYTLRVYDLDGMRGRVAKTKAKGVTPIVKNEFGERSFSFTAPDGYFWTLVEGPR